MGAYDVLSTTQESMETLEFRMFLLWFLKVCIGTLTFKPFDFIKEWCDDNKVYLGLLLIYFIAHVDFPAPHGASITVIIWTPPLYVLAFLLVP